MTVMCAQGNKNYIKINREDIAIKRYLRTNRYLVQLSTKPLLYSNISSLILLCSIFIVSNQRFILVYRGLSLIAVQDGLRIQG